MILFEELFCLIKSDICL